MLSIGSQLAQRNPSMLHSFVDSFFLSKKTMVKDRLRQSMETIVDGLFDQMVEQIKVSLLPPKTGNDQVKPSGTATSTPAKPPTTKSPMDTSAVPPSQPPISKMVFATKSKPGPSSSAASQPFSGLYKRMAEEDGTGTGTSSKSNKKKAITVELQTDGPLDAGDEEDDYSDVALDEGAGGGGSDGAGGGGGNAEQANSSSANAINSLPSTSKELHQPAQSGKYPCTEPNCTKNFKWLADLKRHLRTHTKAKPFGCTYDGCSQEFGRRHDALRHILNVHLKKKKPGDDEEGNENNNEPPDPATYLSVKEELL